VSSVGVQISGTFTTAVVYFEGSLDKDNWDALQAHNVETGAVATSASAEGLWEVPVGAVEWFRARLDWTAGTSITVKVRINEAGVSSLADIDVQAQEDVDVVDRVGRLLGKVTNYDVLASGTLGAAEATVEIASANLGSAGLGITGTWVGTIVVEGDHGDSVWRSIPLIHSLTAAAVTSTTANGSWFIGLAGFETIRVRMSAWTSGTATVYIEGTSAPAGVWLSRSLPTGVNTIGYVVLGAGTAEAGSVGYRPYTTAKSGQITVAAAGTAVVGTTEAGSLFAIKAHPDNTDVIWVGQDGANDVTSSNGFPLEPGETIVLNMANLNQVYFDADVGTEKVCWIKLA